VSTLLIKLSYSANTYSDPLFQHLLVHIIRSNPKLISDSAEFTASVTTWSGLPVIHDEVFTGLYRLGRFSSSTFIQTYPDISVHAKLLTGGLIPLCTTLASDSIYEAFMGDEKRDALLHGHSYTAHPVGCHVANESLKAMMGMEERGEWQMYKDDWNQSAPSPSVAKSEKMGDSCEAWSVWSKDFITNISLSPDVESVITLGSVLAINLKDEHAGKSSPSPFS
jgi:dethiobiotin synthetase/adenosylmethionine--8-amino-7-oxononanoate aminotransferase